MKNKFTTGTNYESVKYIKLLFSSQDSSKLIQNSRLSGFHVKSSSMVPEGGRGDGDCGELNGGGGNFLYKCLDGRNSHGVDLRVNNDIV